MFAGIREPDESRSVEQNGPHISDTRIRDFAYGNLILLPGELIHFQNCDKCSDAWWRSRQEATRGKDPHDIKEKSA